MLTSTDLIRVIRKDHKSYEREFSSRVHNFNAILQLLGHTPKNVTQHDIETIHFLTATCQFYPKITKSQCLPSLFQFLEGSDLSRIPVPPLRAILQLFHHSRQRRMITDDRRYLQLLINLTKIRNKTVRKDVYNKILSECLQRHDSKVHQTIVFQHTRDGHRHVSRLCYMLMIALYRKQIWNKDGRVVNMLCDACTHKDAFTMVTSLGFFLNDKLLEFSDSVDDVIAQIFHLPRTSESEQESSNPRIQQRNILEEMKSAIIKYSGSHSKKTKKRKRKFDTEIKRLRRENKRLTNLQTSTFGSASTSNDGPVSSSARTFHQIFLQIKNPAKFANRLFNRLTTSSSERFEIQLMLMRVLSRTISVHKLSNERVYAFYPFIIRFLEPSTTYITKILAIVAESVHNELNSERIRPLILVLVNRFLHHKAEAYVNAIGLNTIRLICERNPMTMNSQILTTIVEFGKHKIKLVAISARGITNLYRKGELGEILPKKIKRARPEEDEEEENLDDEEDEMDNEEEEDEEEDEEILVDEMDVVMGKEDEPDKEYDPEMHEFIVINESGEEEEDGENSKLVPQRQSAVIGDREIDLGTKPIGEEDEVSVEVEEPGKAVRGQFRQKSISERKKKKQKNFMMVKMGKSAEQKRKMGSRQRRKRKREMSSKSVRWRKKKRRRMF